MVSLSYSVAFREVYLEGVWVSMFTRGMLAQAILSKLTRRVAKRYSRRVPLPPTSNQPREVNALGTDVCLSVGDNGYQHGSGAYYAPLFSQVKWQRERHRGLREIRRDGD